MRSIPADKGAQNGTPSDVERVVLVELGAEMSKWCWLLTPACAKFEFGIITEISWRDSLTKPKKRRKPTMLW